MIKCINYFKEIILDKLPVKVSVAGGALRDYFMYKEIISDSDIDLYLDSKYKIDTLLHFLGRNGAQLSESNSSVKFNFDNKIVDVILEQFDSLEDIIKAFDFTVCCVAADNTRVIFHPTFMSDLKSKKLIINDSEEFWKRNIDLKILKRLQKYVQKGFYAPDETLKNIGTLLKVAKSKLKIDSSYLPQTPSLRINPIHAANPMPLRIWDVPRENFVINQAIDPITGLIIGRAVPRVAEHEPLRADSSVDWEAPIRNPDNNREELENIFLDELEEDEPIEDNFVAEMNSNIGFDAINEDRLRLEIEETRRRIWERIQHEGQNQER